MGAEVPLECERIIAKVSRLPRWIAGSKCFL